MIINVRNSRNVSIDLLPVMLKWLAWVCEIETRVYEGNL